MDGKRIFTVAAVALVLVVIVGYLSVYIISSVEDETDLQENSINLENVTFKNKTVTYDGEYHLTEIEGTLDEGIEVNYYSDDILIEEGFTDAGTYDIVAIFTSVDDTVVPSSLIAVLNIEKADYDMSNISFEDEQFLSNGTMHSVEIEGSLPSGVSVSYEGNKESEYGKYAVTAVFSHENDNYNEIPSMVANMVIYELYALNYEFNGDVVYSEEVRTFNYYNVEKLNNIYDVPANETFIWFYNGVDAYSSGDQFYFDVREDITLEAYYVITTDKYEFEFNEEDSTATLKKYNATNVDLIIYSQVCDGTNVYDVTDISSSVFYKTNIESVVLPDTLVSIGTYSFANTNISEIVIPDSVTYIADAAFQNCKNLTNVTLSENLTELTGNLFAYSGLTEIIIPSNVQTINTFVFQGCSSLTTVTFSNDSKLKEIQEGAFIYSSINFIIIPSTVTIIGSSAFDGCSSLTQVVFNPDSELTTIGTRAFKETALIEVTIPATVTSLGDYIFENCNSLENINVSKTYENNLWCYKNVETSHNVTLNN